MVSSTSHHAWYDTRRQAALWAGLLTGPIVCLVLLEVNYVLAYVACETGSTWFMHLATGIAVAIVALSGWLAWRNGPAEDDQRRSAPVARVTSERRARWMSIGGVALSLWFILVILVMEIPIIMLRTCD